MGGVFVIAIITQGGVVPRRTFETTILRNVIKLARTS